LTEEEDWSSTNGNFTEPRRSFVFLNALLGRPDLWLLLLLSLLSDVPLEGRCALKLNRSKIQWFSDVFAAFFY